MKTPLNILMIQSEIHRGCCNLSEAYRSELNITLKHTIPHGSENLNHGIFDAMILDTKGFHYSLMNSHLEVFARQIPVILLVGDETGAITIQDVYPVKATDATTAIIFNTIETAIAHKRERRQQQFGTSILNSLTAHIAVIDAGGSILMVNSAWKQFAEENGGNFSHIDSNYFEVCRKAADCGDAVAAEALIGIESVVRRDRRVFTMEYACHSPGIQRWFNMTVTPLENSGDATVIIHTDITERTVLQNAILKKEMEYRSLLGTMHDGVLQADNDNIIQFVNPTFLTTFGYSENEVLGRNMSELFLLPEDWEFMQRKNIERERGIADRYEIRMKTRNGELLWVEISGAPHRDTAGAVIGSVAIIRDISDRKRIEYELVESQTLLQKAQSVAQMGSWISDVNFNGKLIWSKEIFKIFNLNEEEFDGRVETFFKFVHPDDIQKVKEASVTATANQTPYEIDHRVVLKDGSIRWVHERAQVICNDDGQPVKMLGVVQDITDRKNTEEHLHQSRELLSLILEMLPVGVWLTDENGMIVMGNQAGQRIWGGARYVGMDRYHEYKGWWHHSGQPIRSHEWAMARAITKGEMTLNEIIDIEGFDGNRRTILNSSEPIRNPDGRIIGAIGVNQDISQLIRTEEALRRSEANIAALINNDIAAIWSVDREYRFVAFNPFFVDEVYKYFGKKPAVGSRINDVFSEEDSSQWKQLYDRAFTGERFTVHTTIPLQSERLEFEVTFNPIFSDGTVTGVGVVSRNITKQKHDEEALRKSEERFRAAAEGSLDAFALFECVFDPDQNVTDFKLIDLNDRMVKLIDKPRREMINRFTDYLPEILNNRETFLKVYESCEPAEEEGVIHSLNQSDRYLYRQMIPLSDGIALTIRDITEQKKAEKAMRESEERFYLAAKATNDVIWDVDPSKGVVVWNDNFKKVFGYSETKTPQQFWIDRVHPDDNARIMEEYRHFLTHNQDIWSKEYRFLCADGSYANVFDRALAIRDSNGNPVRLIGSMMDITNVRKSEAKIREQAALLDITQDAIYMLGLDRNIVYWNKGAEKMYGWTSDEIIGKSNAVLFRQSDDPSYINASDITLKTGEWSGELKKITKHAKEIIVQSRWNTIRDENGNPKSYLIINSDITEKKRLEQQFLLSQRLESVGFLASGIAHDLNNILTPIQMGVYVLMKKTQDPALTDILQTLKISTERGAGIVKQILSFVRGDEGSRVTVPPKHLIGEIVKIIKETFPPVIRIQSDVDPQLYSIAGDMTQLHQALLNLAVNARDAMPHGGELTFVARNTVIDTMFARMHPHAKSGHHVVITVQDTGIGIPPENISKIFDPFFTTKEAGKGTGLGLFSVHSIIKNHGGFIDVLSEPGHGTQFNLYLPAVMESFESGIGELQLSQGHGECILIVDDEPSIREVTRSTLEASGYTVMTAGDGTEAVAMYAQDRDRIQAVILDLMMPHMDGRATVKALRRINPDVKAILMSGMLDSQKILETADLGHVDFLLKPFSTEKVLTLLQKVLSTA